MKPKPVDPENMEEPPTCVAGCVYLQIFETSRQGNTLRMETASMIDPKRCGWNIKPGAIGGHPLDYAPCLFNPNNKENL